MMSNLPDSTSNDGEVIERIRRYPLSFQAFNGGNELIVHRNLAKSLRRMGIDDGYLEVKRIPDK